MDKLWIDRVITGYDGSFGVISIERADHSIHKVEKIPFALTVERQWLDNKQGISCIPEGDYIALRCNSSPEYGYNDSPRFGDTFNVTEVSGRSKILFHKGNVDDDSHGCIIIGEQFGSLHESTAVLSSRQGYGEFMSLLKGKNEFELSIRNHF